MNNKLSKLAEGLYIGKHIGVSFSLYCVSFAGKKKEWTFTYETSIGISEAEDVFSTRKAALAACRSWIQYKLTASPKLFI